MQIINGKHYNDYKIGGYILLVPVYGKEGEYFVLGEMKDLMLGLKEFSDKAHEENKKLYQEARERYKQTHQRLTSVIRILNALPRTDDIETLETKRQLTEEKRQLESDLYFLSERVDQLYHKDFVPEKPKEAPKLELHNQKMTQPNLAETGRPETAIDPKSDGYKVRQLRHQLREDQRTFAKRFRVTQGMVSNCPRDAQRE